jgi:hypothetical protein
MDMNLAFLDYRAHEEIFEAYNYKFGYYDKSIPYYMIAHEGKMHHIEHEKNSLDFWINYWKLISSGAELDPSRVESIKPARNAVNIFWEYIKKEAG